MVAGSGVTTIGHTVERGVQLRSASHHLSVVEPTKATALRNRAYRYPGLAVPHRSSIVWVFQGSV